VGAGEAPGVAAQRPIHAPHHSCCAPTAPALNLAASLHKARNEAITVATSWENAWAAQSFIGSCFRRN
jgi:hypothetical protein